MTFRPGQRVELNELGRRLRPRTAVAAGVFVGPSLHAPLVRVLFDGNGRASDLRPEWLRAEPGPEPFTPEWLERRAYDAAFARP